MAEVFLTILFTSPLPVALVVLGVLCVVLAIIGTLPPIQIQGGRAIALGGFGLLLIMISVGSAWAIALASGPVPPSGTLTPTESNGGNQKAVIIDSRLGWQSTGVLVRSGDRIVIEVTDGEWTSWNGEYPHSPGEGGGYVCPGCGDPAFEGIDSNGLIGRIQEQKFIVGIGSTILAEQSGELLLRINDEDAGLGDNDGALTVQITITQ
jgi:hypothetical protein